MPTTLFRLSDFIPLHRAKSDSDKVVSNKAVIFYINHLGQDVRGVGDVVKLADPKVSFNSQPVVYRMPKYFAEAKRFSLFGLWLLLAEFLF